MYMNHVASTPIDVPLTVTAAALREMHGDDETLAETNEAVLEAYRGFIASILQRKVDDGDIDADGGITITAEDVQVERDMAWVPAMDQPGGLTPSQKLRYKTWCRTGLVPEDLPY